MSLSYLGHTHVSVCLSEVGDEKEVRVYYFSKNPLTAFSWVVSSKLGAEELSSARPLSL